MSLLRFLPRLLRAPVLCWRRTVRRSNRVLGYLVRTSHAGDHAAHQEKIPPTLAGGRLAAQFVEVLLAPAFRFFVQPLQVLDRVLLDILEVHGAPLAHIEIEQGRVSFATT